MPDGAKQRDESRRSASASPNRIARLLRESRLPLEKSLPTFDQKRLPQRVSPQAQALPFSKWEAIFKDPMTTAAAIDSLVAGERAATAVILAHIAEVDLRRLDLPAGDNSMDLFCVGALGLSEGAAFRRVQSTRAARRFPALFDAIASGRLHLTAVSMLAPHLPSLPPRPAPMLLAPAAAPAPPTPPEPARTWTTL